MYKDRDEVIILTALMPDPINTYLEEFREGVVKKVNDVTIRSMKDLAAAFSKQADEYVLEFEGAGRPLVLLRSDIEAARERIRQRYNVLKEQYLDDEGTTGVR